MFVGDTHLPLCRADANPEARLALVGGGPAMDDYRRVFEGYKVNFVGPLSGDELSQRCVHACM